jgi:hypothetical protein
MCLTRTRTDLKERLCHQSFLLAGAAPGLAGRRHDATRELQRIIALLWAVALGAIAMSVVAAGLLLSTRKGGGR